MKKGSGLVKKLARRTSFTIEAAQAKYPRLRMQIRVTFVRVVIWSGSIIGIGRVANTKSVKMLIAEEVRSGNNVGQCDTYSH